MNVKCKCKGVPQRGFMCMHVTPIDKYCTKKEECKYQEKQITQSPKSKKE